MLSAATPFFGFFGQPGFFFGQPGFYGQIGLMSGSEIRIQAKLSGSKPEELFEGRYRHHLASADCKRRNLAFSRGLVRGVAADTHD
jgi:hypothetical protein